MGEGDSETSFHDYFSAVYLFSNGFGLYKRSIKDFNDNYPEDDSAPPEVIERREYCYIAIRVAKGYTLTVDDFAFFAKADGVGGVLSLDFFISPSIPSNVVDKDSEEKNYYPQNPDDTVEYEGEYGEADKDDDGNDTDREGEVNESDLFKPFKSYAKTQFTIYPDVWESTHLEFGDPQVAKAGEFIIVRVRNNCQLVDETLSPDSPENQNLTFTFNYLMFHFSKVVKS